MKSDQLDCSTTMNNLPDELLICIFEYLNIKDVIQCSLVCRRFKLICSCVKIPELIITNAIENIRDNWFYTNKPLNHRDAIDVTTFNLYRSMFRLDKFRRLHFLGTKTEYDQLNVNDLSQLEQLKIEASEMEDYHFETVIDLPNLKIIEIKGAIFVHEFFIRAPKLEILKCKYCYCVHLTYPETIKHLEVSGCCQLPETMRNLELFQIDGAIVDFKSDILSVFPKLRMLAIKNRLDSILDSELDCLCYLIEEKCNIQRPEFRMYLECVELDDVNKLDEFCNVPNILTFQINNYHSLGENITCGYEINYNTLMVACEGKIPGGFAKKYFNTRSFSVTDKVENQRHLLQFLKSFDHLRKLWLQTESLDQYFYDSLCELDQLKSLHYVSKSIINFDFLLKLKLLEDFETTADSPTFPDLALELFRNLKYFRFIRFYFKTERFIIIRDRKTNEYETRRFCVAAGPEWCFKNVHLDFSGLVGIVDTFRFSKVDFND